MFILLLVGYLNIQYDIIRCWEHHNITICFSLLINSFGFGPKIFRESFKGDILEYYGNDGKNYDSVLRGSHHNKQLVSETAFGFIQENPTWEFTTDPIHLNLEANKHLSKIYYEQITSGKPIVSFESGKTFI